MSEELKALIEKMGGTTSEALKELTERMDGLELKLKRPGNGGSGDRGDLAAELKAIGAYARGNETELKTMMASSDPDGGFMVPAALSSQMTKRIFDQSPMGRLCRTETFTVGDAFEEPVDKDDIGASWVGERSSRPATTTAQLGMLRVPVNEMYALQPITQRLLDDSRFDLGTWIEGKIGDKFGRTEGAAFVNGDGVLKPQGFLNYGVAATPDATRDWGVLQYVVSGSAANVSDVNGQANGIKDLYWSMKPAHRANATWLMAGQTASAIDKLKDGQNNYIWRDGMTAGAPPSLLGRPVEFCEDMPAVGANAFPIAFGDWKAGYLIAQKPSIRVLRDPFTDKPNVQFYAYRRVGGGLANSEAIKLLKCSA